MSLLSYFLVFSIICSILISFTLYERNIYGTSLAFGGIKILDHNINLYVDNSSLIVALILGFTSLFAMIISFLSLERRKGYVRYFISLGFISGSAFIFSFSGNIFHDFFDPLLSSLDKIGISFL